ncbi:MAG: TetR/AcrR family transcriptional regulator [Bifidobacteriaceae bacterium]|jgi:AcrR family transcriptional regulator|nr:TetR/AcrR family transcriptional regulator [Bifidobacteriaceae bacterium]
MPKGLTRKREARLGAILDAAADLFTRRGYDQTTVDDILAVVGMGKGTFYHYFKSKEDVLEGVVDRLVALVVQRVEAIAEAPGLDGHTRLVQMIAAVNVEQTPDGGIVGVLHEGAIARLHQASITRTIRLVAPVLAKAVEQGVAEGVYSTPRPLETVEFLLAGDSAMFDFGMFDWTEEQFASRVAEFVRIMELALGAAEGSFGFLAEAPRQPREVPAGPGAAKDRAPRPAAREDRD